MLTLFKWNYYLANDKFVIFERVLTRENNCVYHILIRKCFCNPLHPFNFKRLIHFSWYLWKGLNICNILCSLGHIKLSLRPGINKKVNFRGLPNNSVVRVAMPLQKIACCLELHSERILTLIDLHNIFRLKQFCFNNSLQNFSRFMVTSI